jgi:hypothetical protein
MTATEAVTLRHAGAGDAPAIARLARALPPAGALLLAEIDGEVRAALSLADGSILADPLHPSEAALELLRARALQLQDAHTPRRRWRRRLRRGRLVAPCR